VRLRIELIGELGGLAQLLGLGVELGVQGQHAAVGFLELHPQVVRLPPARLQGSCQFVGGSA
jgi:hypothetical protein